MASVKGLSQSGVWASVKGLRQSGLRASAKVLRQSGLWAGGFETVTPSRYVRSPPTCPLSDRS